MLLFDETRGSMDEEMEFDYARFDPTLGGSRRYLDVRLFACEDSEWSTLIDVWEILLPITIGRMLDNKR